VVGEKDSCEYSDNDVLLMSAESAADTLPGRITYSSSEYRESVAILWDLSNSLLASFDAACSWEESRESTFVGGNGGGVIRLRRLGSDSYESDSMGDDMAFRKVGVGVLSGGTTAVLTGRSVWEGETKGIDCFRGGGGVRAVRGSVGVATRAGK
jgi:hypothetical protein